MMDPPVKTPALLRRAASVLADRYGRLPEAVRLGARIGGITAALYLAETALLRVTRLPVADYERPVLAVAWIRHLLSHPATLTAAVLAACTVGLMAWKRTLGPRWEDVELGKRLRVLALLAAALLGWTYATYPFNAYYGQVHAADRVLVVMGVALLAWRPVFIWVFLSTLLVVVWQFAMPLGGFSWAEPLLLVRVLVVLGIAYLARASVGRIRSADVLFILFALVASHYWVPGVGKLQLVGWLTDDHLYYLLPSTYANGWLRFLEPTTIDRLTGILAAVDVPLKAFTLVAEAGALFALARRGLLRAFLVGWAILHAGIFLTTGFFFWKWMLLEAALLVLFAGPKRVPLPIFSRAHFGLSLVLIGGGALWFRPVKLAWRDVPVSYTYRFEAEAADGTRHLLSARFFEPYGYQFTIGGFSYVLDVPRLPISGGGVMQNGIAAATEGVRTLEELQHLEEARDRQTYNERRAERLDAFLRTFIAGRRAHEASSWAYLEAPPLLWTFPYRPSLPADAEIERVVISHVTSLYGDGRYQEVRVEPVRVVDLTPPPGEPAL